MPNNFFQNRSTLVAYPLQRSAWTFFCFLFSLCQKRTDLSHRNVQRVVRHWHKLPRDAVDAPSFKTFKARSDWAWADWSAKRREVKNWGQPRSYAIYLNVWSEHHFSTIRFGAMATSLGICSWAVPSHCGKPLWVHGSSVLCTKQEQSKMFFPLIWCTAQPGTRDALLIPFSVFVPIFLPSRWYF